MNLSMVIVLVFADTEITEYKIVNLQASPQLQYENCLEYCTTGSYYCIRLVFVKHAFIFYYKCFQPQYDSFILG